MENGDQIKREIPEFDLGDMLSQNVLEEEYQDHTPEFSEYFISKASEKPFKCESCDKSFSRIDVLRMHNFIHTGEKPYKCNFCEYACRDPTSLKRHEARHMGILPQYRCQICKYKCEKKWALKQHVAEKHLNLDVRKYKCGQCEKNYKKKVLLNNHIRSVHDQCKPYQCDVCKKYLTTRSNLMSHMNRHFGERVSACDYDGCGKTFKTKGEMQKHRIIHYPKEQKPCPDCGKRFTRQARLDRHRMVMHRTRWRNTPCAECGIRFYSQSYLDKHMRTVHNEDRDTYMCDYCGMRYNNKPGLIVHMRHKHFKKKKHTCDICGEKFKNLTPMKRHKWLEHGVKCMWQKRKKKELPINIADVKIEAIDVEENDLEEVLRRMEQCQDKTIDFEEPAYPNEVLTQDIAKSIISKNSNDLKNVPEVVFDNYYIERIVGNRDVDEKNTKSNMAENMDDSQKLAKECIEDLLQRVRKKIELKALARSRGKIENYIASRKRQNSLLHNAQAAQGEKLIKAAVKNQEDEYQDVKEIETTKVERVYNIDRPRRNSSVRNYMDFFKEPEMYMVHDEDVPGPKEKIQNNVKTVKTCKRKIVRSSTNKMAAVQRKAEVPENPSEKFKFNAFQCYACFQLFETKRKLIEHCKQHFNVDNKRRITKCPFCDFEVSTKRHGIWRHMRKEHGVKFNYTSSELTLLKNPNTNEKKFVVRLSDKTADSEAVDNSDTLKDIGVTEMEIRPSIEHLNKQLAVELDRKNRNKRYGTVLKKRLVRKDKEWFVEMEEVHIEGRNIKDVKKSDYVGKQDLSKDLYLEEMIKLSKSARKEGRKILFPCNMCSKVCTALCGLKLHRRVHNANAKPFRPKIWKHKMEQRFETPKPLIKAKEGNEENRRAKPKSIPKKRYRCDENLKEFFKNNITGSDVEFEQFLREYRKVSKIHKDDLEKLEDDKEFGIKKTTDVERRHTVKNRKIDRIIKKNKQYIRVIMLSKREWKNRIERINALRAKNRLGSRT
ncbi:Zinc finger protein 595 [Eumeta japonica]|uniref:Zinc finger protein 595 n=1 Tax=Eumeta variegata TaxID=151549 RepID=A0A4C1TAW4_EUMVA|nr:Zinc finger protein 595 [Eumeta japonica]